MAAQQLEQLGFGHLVGLDQRIDGLLVDGKAEETEVIVDAANAEDVVVVSTSRTVDGEHVQHLTDELTEMALFLHNVSLRDSMIMNQGTAASNFLTIPRMFFKTEKVQRRLVRAGPAPLFAKQFA